MKLSPHSLVRWFVLPGGWLLLLILSGCGKDGIVIYSVPKEKASVVAQADAGPSEMPHIHYQTPAGWTEQAAGGIRVARFSVRDAAGQEAEVSVVPLPGASIPKTEVLNMWREQIRLPRLPEDELAKAGQSVRIGSVTGEIFDMTSTEPLVADKHRARVLVAMLEKDGAMWFFKISGAEELVGAQKENFQEFLKSITFDTSTHGEMDRSRVASTKVKTIPTPSTIDPPQWIVPSGWKTAPPGDMVLARFSAAEADSGKAEVTVSSFPGAAGGTLDNVNRWRRQIGLAPVGVADLSGMVSSLDQAGDKAILVDMTGKDVRSGDARPVRIVAAVVSRESDTWYYKLMGDVAAVEREKNAFVSFVQSARYPNVP